MLSFFRSHQPLALFILPVIAVLLWLPAFIDPRPFSVEHTMPLYELSCKWLADQPFISTLIGVILVTGGAFLLNYIVSAHEVLGRYTYLPALFYVVLMSCTRQMLTLHPLLFANIFIMLALHKLYSTYRRDLAFAQVFDAGSLVAIACLFYLPAIVLFPIIWVGLAVLRPFIWREWLISLFGLVMPFLFVAVFYYWYGQLRYLWEDKMLFPIKNRFFQFQLSRSFIMLLVVLSWLFLLSAAQLITGIRVSKLKAKNTLLVLVWLSLFSAVSMLLAPTVSVTYYAFLVLPLAIFFANYFSVVKRGWWAELMFWLLVGSIIFNHVFAA